MESFRQLRQSAALACAPRLMWGAPAPVEAQLHYIAMKAPTAKVLMGLAALAATCLTVHAQYTFTTLDNPGAVDGIYLWGISGTNIVGSYNDASNFEHGFVYTGSTWSALEVPTSWGDRAVPAGISGANIVGTYSDISWNIGGFLYNGATWTPLDDPIEWFFFINTGTFPQGTDGTNIVGYYTDTNGLDQGFLYSGSTWTTLEDPLGVEGTFAQGISGTNIVGYYYGRNYLSINFIVHGFLYNGSTWTTLDYPMSPSGSTWVRGIDGTNIVGSYAGTNNVSHGFIYNGIAWTTLDDPLAGSGTGQGTWANGISGANVVGYYYDSNNIAHGFLAAPIPQLTITPSGNTLKISWPSWASSYALQQNFDLDPTNWVNTAQPPMLNASNMQYELALNPAFVFRNSRYNFRLKQER